MNVDVKDSKAPVVKLLKVESNALLRAYNILKGIAHFGNCSSSRLSAAHLGEVLRKHGVLKGSAEEQEPDPKSLET